MDIFLKAKAWQIFLALLGVPIVLQITMQQFMSHSFAANPMVFLLTASFVTLIFVFIFLCWLWSMGIGINKRIQKELRPKSKFFRFTLIYSAVYILIFQIFFTYAAIHGANGNILVILPFHFFAMFCTFYAIYFIAKNLGTYEKNAPVKFWSFAGAFFLLWFFPVGIWFIQPRINKLYASTNE